MNTLRILLACTIIASTAHMNAVKRSICDTKNDKPVVWDMVPNEIITKLAAYCDYNSRNMLMKVSKRFNFFASKKNNTILYEPNVKLSEKDTLYYLLLGCEKNDYRLIQNLLTYHSDDRPIHSDNCNKRNRGTALRYAVENDNIKLIKFLLADSTTLHKTMSLDCAIKNNKVIAVQTILTDKTVPINTIDWYGNTPLHYAAGKQCIARKLNLDFSKALSSDTCAYDALVQEQHTEMVQLLIARNAIPVNVQNKNGETALDCAEQRGYTTIVNMLRSLQ